MAKVVLVHGAWHGAWCWDGVVAQLDQLGVQSVAVELPFTGFADDVAAARSEIDAAEPGAVVVGHSYGGVVITQAAAGASHVRHLVYVAAFMTDIGEDFSAALADSGFQKSLVVDEAS